MKKAIKAIALPFVRNKSFWHIIQCTLGVVSIPYNKLNALRIFSEENEKKAQEDNRYHRITSRHMVLNGPFKGMKYPRLQARGSRLYPKLLGSYEKELSTIIGIILRRKYDVIVDIGCAEGYYAVGLGMHMSTVKIFAYDTDKEALRLCEDMGALNGVKVNVGEFCDQATLRNLDLGERALIVSDCEGYETTLFDQNMASYLERHDILIESHDWVDIGTTRRLWAIFSETHECEIIESVDDIAKAYTYNFEELKDFDLSDRHRVLTEGRKHIMKWIFAKSKY